MSGIAGIFNLDGRPVKQTDLQDMTNSLRRRGPHGSDIWHQGPVGLCHQLLWTTSESFHERITHLESSSHLAITADARIDNREDLLLTLGFVGASGKESTDSQLILAAYEKWGEQCPEKLLGDFAFAIWDGRVRTLFCARDHMGSKPFFYFITPHFFAFASEIRALLCLAEIPRRLNEERIILYLHTPLEPGREQTSYQDILRFPPASFMKVSPGEVRLETYWSPNGIPELCLASNEEYAEAFLSIFRQAVSCRLRNASGVGVMLSGGVDSSSIACQARRLLIQKGNQGLPTFSCVSDIPSQCCESPFITRVIAQRGILPTIIQADKVAPFVSDLEECLGRQDEPFDAEAMFMPKILFRAADDQGLSILLDGIDGDGIVSLPYNYLSHLLRSESWGVLIREIIGVSRTLRQSLLRVFFTYCLLPAAPDSFKRTFLRVRNRFPGSNYNYNPLINPDFARRMHLRESLETRRVEMYQAAGNVTGESLHYINSGTISEGLEAYDRTASAFAIEPRHPLLDKRLVEFCLSLPWDQKIFRGWSKIILRRAMAGILPPEVQRRRDRQNIAPRFIQTLVSSLERVIDQVFRDDLKIVRDYLNVPAAQQIYQRYKVARSWQDADTLWGIVSLTFWFKRIFN